MNRGIVIGCSIVLLTIVIVVWALISAAPKIVRAGKSWFSAQISEWDRLAAAEKNWQPPSPTLHTGWFPAQMGDWFLVNASMRTEVPEVKLTRPAAHAIYRHANGRNVEMTIVAASDAETDELFQVAQETLRKRESTTMNLPGNSGTVTMTRGGWHIVKQVGKRTHVISTGNEHTRLWWMKGWLFIAGSVGADPKDFADTFIAATTPLESAELSPPRKELPEPIER